MSSRSRSSAVAVSLIALVSCSVSQPPDPSRPRGAVSIGTKAISELDPMKISTPDEMLAIRTACDGLVALDPWSGDPRPALAASWSFKDEGMTLAISLKQGAKFQDGTKVTAGAVRERLLMVMDPANGSPWGRLLDAVRGAPGPEVSESIRAVDATHVTIALSAPSADLVSALAHPSLVPVRVGSDPTTPVCSGPYRISRETDGRVKLSHSGSDPMNEAYLEKGRGFLSLITFVPFPSEEEAFDAYKAGKVHVAPIPSNRFVETDGLGRSYARGSTLEITYLAFSPTDPDTSDPRLRTAISLALDRLLLVDAAFGDQREPATRWWSSEPSAATSTCARVARKVSDPDAALAAWKEAGRDPSSVRLKLSYDSDSVSRLVAQALEVKIRDVLGIGTTLDPLSSESFDQSLAAREPGTIWLVTSQAQLPTVGQMLGSLFHSKGTRNPTGIADPEVDRALSEAEMQGSRAGRVAKGVEAEDLICQKMLAAPLWWGVRHWAMDSKALRSQSEARIDLFGAPVLRQVSLP